MNNLGTGLLDKIKYQTSGIHVGLLVSPKIFEVFSHTSLCKTCDSGMEPFDPGAII